MKTKVTFDGQTGEETLGSEVRLKWMTESAGEGKSYENIIYTYLLGEKLSGSELCLS